MYIAYILWRILTTMSMFDVALLLKKIKSKMCQNISELLNIQACSFNALERRCTQSLVDSYMYLVVPLICTTVSGILIDLMHNSHNAPVPYPTTHYFVAERYTCVQTFVTKFCIVGYLFNPLWDRWDGLDLWDWSLARCAILSRGGSSMNNVICRLQWCYEI